MYFKNNRKCVIIQVTTNQTDGIIRTDEQERGIIMGMTMTQKILAAHAGLDHVEAGQLIMNKRKMFKPVCANVDFYSGFVYSMLAIPEEMFTPMFATARISGWCAHRLEELVNAGKIIRPAYKYVGWHRDYPKMEERK